MCMQMCIHMFIDMCMHMCIDTCIDVCIDIVDMRMDMCMDMCRGSVETLLNVPRTVLYPCRIHTGTHAKLVPEAQRYRP